MSGNNNVLLDTNVIIFASKGVIDIGLLLGDYDSFYTSIISYMEVYGYDFKSEQERQVVDEIFANLEIVDLGKEIADQVVVYRSSGGKKIKLPDAVILATAKYLNADLLTDDWDDFQGLDKDVNIVDLSRYK